MAACSSSCRIRQWQYLQVRFTFTRQFIFDNIVSLQGGISKWDREASLIDYQWHILVLSWRLIGAMRQAPSPKVPLVLAMALAGSLAGDLIAASRSPIPPYS